MEVLHRTYIWKKQPVIFAVTHIGKWDFEIVNEQIANTFIPKEKLEYWQMQKDLKTGLLPRWYEMALSEMEQL